MRFLERLFASRAARIWMLLDTFVVRSLLVPALVFDAGGQVWWPSALARRRQARRPADAEIAVESVREVRRA